ncbi:MAG: amidohydrolase, partial [Candidatus Eisenbacteria bacterium]|nr:amidohydrolase [Candidatus Eisenbacteria bacterium]
GFIRLDHLDACSANMMSDEGKFFRKIESNCWDPATRIEDLDRFGIEKQVLSTVPVMFCYWAKPEDGLYVARFLNDHIAATVRAHPDRFVGLGTVPMQSPDLAIQELKRCRTELGLAGIEIGSHVGAINLGDPEVLAVLEAAEALDAAVFVHPWDMMGTETMPKYWLPWLVGMPAETSRAICSMIFGGVFERFPKLRVLFAHGGGSFPMTMGRVDHGFQVRPDLCAVDNNVLPSSYVNRFFVDSLVHDQRALRFLLDTFGSGQIALGTDYPFPLGELEPGKLIDSMKDISTQERELMLHGTARKFLGLKQPGEN